MSMSPAASIRPLRSTTTSMGASSRLCCANLWRQTKGRVHLKFFSGFRTVSFNTQLQLGGWSLDVPKSQKHLRRKLKIPSLFLLAKPLSLRHLFPMQSHELLREVFQKNSAKQAAAELG